MISRLPRFAGAVAALAAGALAAAPSAHAQASASSAALFPAALRSAVSGIVRDRAGHPQIGVLVELLDPRYNVIARTFTDDRGRYRLPRLRAGLYQLRATDELSLPTLRPNLRLLEDSRSVVDLTLSTLYQALAWLPATPRAADAQPDDWDWTLRLSASRPLLRMFDPGPQASGGPVFLQSGEPAGDAANRQFILAQGPRAFGQGGIGDRMLWTGGNGETRALLFGAQSSESVTGLARIGATAAFRQQLSPDRSTLTVVTLTDRPQIVSAASSSAASGGLTTFRVRSASVVELGPAAELTAGAELAVARLGQGSAVFAGQPFAGVTLHAGNATIAYSVATAPTLTSADRLQQQARQDEPAVVEQNGTLHLEQGLHQQLSVTHQAGRWTEEAAIFDDSLDHPVVEGALVGGPGDSAAIDSSDVLYDPGTGTIAVSGAGYHNAGGVLAMLRDQLDPGTWLSLRYALGEAVSLPGAGPHGASLTAFAAPFAAAHSSMLAISGGTRIAATGTTLRAAYRWQSANTLTPVAPFDSAVPGAYLSFALRQPLHLRRLGESAGSSRVEAILDVRNLLAQGYRPFLSQDGTTVYFAQEQRCLAAGMAFSF